MPTLFVLPPLLLVVLWVLATRTMPRELPRTGGKQVVAGLLVYPAACAGLVLLIARTDDVYPVDVLSVVVPGLVFGAVIRRLWIAAIPLVAAAVGFSIGYLQDPSCTDCGEEDWFSLIVGSSIFVVVPAACSLLIGILVRNLTPRVRGRWLRR